jgi:hypothetical protein
MVYQEKMEDGAVDRLKRILRFWLPRGQIRLPNEGVDGVVNSDLPSNIGYLIDIATG